MSGDVYTETSTEGWFSRIGKSFTSVLVGFVLFVLGFPVLWWNEGNVVHTEAGYAEGKAQSIDIDAAKLDPAANGKLVHLSGLATTDETLRDDVFGVSAVAIKLERIVQMYQWDEEERTKTEKQLGGGEKTVKTYSYHKKWATSPISSGNFKQPNGHQNPGSLPFANTGWTAKKTTLGAYTLSPRLVDQISNTEKLPVTSDVPKPSLEQTDPNAGTLPPDAPNGLPVPAATGDQSAPAPPAPPANLADFKVVAGEYYRGNPSDPQIGDVKVSFEVVKPADVSVLAKLNGETFEPWTSSNNTEINLLVVGTSSREAMFKTLADRLSMFTWILRFVGFLMMFIGLSAMASPLSVLADVVPFIGDIVGMGTAFFAGIFAAFFALSTIAVAWLFYRPLYGVLLLAAAVGVVFLGRMLFARKRELPQQFSPEGA